MPVRRFDPPAPPAIRFSGADREKMIRVQREVADLLVRIHRVEAVESGIIAFALANLTREFLGQYPDRFRDRLVDTVISHILKDAPNVTESDRRLISLH